MFAKHFGYHFGRRRKVGSHPIHHTPDVDGIWGWMIVLSSFSVHILIMGSQMALGVLNIEWLEEFNQSRGLTAWVSSLNIGITLIVGPFICLLISLCGCRKTAIVGGLLHALGWILSAYARSVQCLFLTFGMTSGIGSGMVYLPAVVMVGQYFHRRRAIAQGLSTMGTGFGAFLMTALLKYLCAEFGWRNAMFIQGAISLNLCVCGALLRPIPVEHVEHVEHEHGEKHVATRNSEDHQAKVLSHSSESLKSNEILSEELEKKEVEYVARRNSEDHQAKVLSHSSESLKSNEILSEELEKKEVKYVARRSSEDDEAKVLSHSSESLKSNEILSEELEIKEVKYVARRNSEDDEAKVLSHSSESLKSNEILSEELEKKEVTNEEVLDSVQQTEIGGKSESGRNIFGLRILKRVRQLTVTVREGSIIWYHSYFGAASLFTNRVFVAFIIWALFAYSSFVIPLINLPEIVNEYNLSAQNDIFPLTSIIAVVHIFGKVVLGIISDLPYIRAWNIFLMANLGLVACIFALPLLHTYVSLAVVCVLMGFFSGYFSLMPVVTEDLVGFDHLTNAYGILICASGISALFGPPFAGWIYDLTNKYDFSFYISGLLYMLGTLFLLIQPYIQKKQAKEKSTEEAQV